jgi:hypothetical protein
VYSPKLNHRGVAKLVFLARAKKGFISQRLDAARTKPGEKIQLFLLLHLQAKKGPGTPSAWMMRMTPPLLPGSKRGSWGGSVSAEHTFQKAGHSS